MSSEGRRRRTVFRKLRQLCQEFNMEAVVVLTDSMNRQWIYKSHDYVPAMRQARILEMTMRITRTNDETGVLASADENQRRLFHFEVELRAQIVSSSTIIGLESVGFMLGHCKSLETASLCSYISCLDMSILWRNAGTEREWTIKLRTVSQGW
jgi:hypothetical protein